MSKMIGFVEGADVFLVIALLLFLFVFVVSAVYMITLSKEQTTELSNLPFESNKLENNEN